jgi:hypothetical protein
MSENEAIESTAGLPAPTREATQLAMRRAVLSRAARAMMRARARELGARAEATVAHSQELQRRNLAAMARARSLLRAREPAPALDTQTQLRSTLRAASIAYARDLREARVPPQTMLVLVKSAIDVPLDEEVGLDMASAMRRDVVRWAIDGYYSPGA